MTALAIYLQDHLAGATAGLELARRAARTQRGTPAAEELARLRDEVARDRQALVQVMRTLGVRRQAYKALGGWLLEKAGRLKTNGHLLSRAPVSDLVEREALRLGVEGKACLWRALLALEDPRLDGAALQSLLDRAQEQARTLERLRLDAARTVLRG